MKDAKKCYERRKRLYETLHQKQSKAASRISNLRLAVFISGIAGTAALFSVGYYYLCGAVFTASLVLFILLVLKHQQLLENRNYSEALGAINQKSMERLAGQWTNFSDTGEDFADSSHSYSSDLDIFGDGSLFQYANTAHTFLGRQKLAAVLANPCMAPKEIERRQEAVVDLAKRLKWRQRLEAESLMLPGKYRFSDPQPLFAWTKEIHPLYGKRTMILFVRLLPLTVFLLLIFSLVFSILPVYIPAIGLAAQWILLLIGRKKRAAVLDVADQYRRDIKVYMKMLQHLEKEHFQSSYLKERMEGMQNSQKHTASRQVKNLEKIIDAISNRNNFFYFAFNVLTLWDYQCLISFEKWKSQSGKLLHVWLDVLGEMEALASLAVIRFDHPGWCMPRVIEGSPSFKATALGHPLLNDNRICNNLIFHSPMNVMLVTGSNMSGKSTFLRTAGINLVLAYAGAPVCAADFSCSVMRIFTCMRVSDNLEKSISSFYAELLRIKMLVEAVEQDQSVFFLLDEIFKGTNSRDRHTGAKILVKKLSRAKTLGLVSTHDLELGELDKESEGIRNYHFQEYYRDDGIFFDYKLRPGVSATRNAAYLMRMAGIDVSDGL